MTPFSVPDWIRTRSYSFLYSHKRADVPEQKNVSLTVMTSRPDFGQGSAEHERETRETTDGGGDVRLARSSSGELNLDVLLGKLETLPMTQHGKQPEGQCLSAEGGPFLRARVSWNSRELTGGIPSTIAPTDLQCDSP